MKSFLFPSLFNKCPNPKGKLFLQDGYPSQNSCKARSAWDKIGARKFSIPARSADLNPIENIFHIVKKKLHQDVLENSIDGQTDRFDYQKEGTEKNILTSYNLFDEYN